MKRSKNLTLQQMVMNQRHILKNFAYIENENKKMYIYSKHTLSIIARAVINKRIFNIYINM